MIRRLCIVFPLTLVLLTVAAPAWACGGLIGPRGSVNLLRTTTFAGYVDGVEHYVTAFTFTGGGGGEFGSLVPLPGVPTKVERGGKWTLQRLQREIAPDVPQALSGAVFASADRSAKVILETKIDALDITVLEGGADEVGVWAADHGFLLPPDAPEVLEFYASRSPYFMAARFDAAAAAARGQQAGDGTPIHLTIPTDDPWVPLRILGLGKGAAEPVQADVFLLTEGAPAMLPAPIGADAPAGTPRSGGMRLVTSERASDPLLDDLRSDDGMGWIPRSGMHLTAVSLDLNASDLTFDLAIDAGPERAPSWIDAGFAGFGDVVAPASDGAPLGMIMLALVAVLLLVRRGFALGS